MASQEGVDHEKYNGSRVSYVIVPLRNHPDGPFRDDELRIGCVKPPEKKRSGLKSDMLFTVKLKPISTSGVLILDF